ncbi:UbiA family prenyltransferase [Aspergillus candidus]|uniref:UbiA prenyltransferase family-domain-containing protein n=1 Tax=Aspergillus candidus TaxID=41067 RepID=A0A2I2FK32_ASPCN|nr:UbiA prenyltransferase family-domain-containing protein [Aspergillus candidus]PLB40962.1 UbiA prenyltransferase family-domain-containing protein [Aspergillus candidus]
MSLHNELHLTERLLRGNIREGLILPMVGLLARLFPVPGLILSLTLSQVVLLLVKTTVCFVCHLYVFELINQVTSVAEDAANKPYRPIPSGLLSVRGAHRRWAISWVVCPLAAAYIFGNGAESGWLFVEYEAWTYFCYVWPRPNNWFFRNAFATVGTYNMFRLLDTVIQSTVPTFPVLPTRVILALAAWVMATVQMQEFQDVEGDRATNKRTLAVIVGPRGERVLRAVTALLVLGAGAVLLCVTYTCLGRDVSPGMDRAWLLSGMGLTSALYTLFAGVVGVRLHLDGGIAFDRKTYKRFYMLAAYMMVGYLSFWNTWARRVEW